MTNSEQKGEGAPQAAVENREAGVTGAQSGGARAPVKKALNSRISVVQYGTA